MIGARPLIVWSLSLAGSALAASHAMGMVFERQNPALAVEMIPANGQARSKLGDALLLIEAAKIGGKLPKVLPAGAAALARDAYRLEPLAPSAIHLVALEYASKGQVRKARDLMQLDLALSKRDGIATFWLIEHASSAKGPENVYELFDMLLRTNRRASIEVLPAMATILQRDEAIEPFTRLLRRQPPWSGLFWQRVVRTAPALENAARLRTMLTEDEAGIAPEDEAELLNNLVAQRKFDAARMLRAHLLDTPLQSAGLVNGDFKNQPAFPPFDWALASEGDFGATIDPQRAQMTISALPGSGGVAAHQIFTLEPGRYRAAMRLQQPIESSRLELSVACAEMPKAARAVAAVPRGGRSAEVDFATGSCRYFQLSLSFTIPEEAQPEDIAVSSVRVQKVQ